MRTTDTRVLALLLLVAAGCRAQRGTKETERVTLAGFSGEVDALTGAVRLRGEPIPAGGGSARLASVEIPVATDGVPGSGPSDTVELVTESVATVPGGCGAVDGFEGAIRLRSFYAGAVLTNVHIELLTLTPTGHEACNSAPATGELSAALGLWDYGTIGRAGSRSDSAARPWRFRLPDMTNFSFRGRVVGDLVTADPTPPVTVAAPGAGTYPSGQSVELRCTDAETGCAATYYTVDGTAPTTASPVYSAPIPIASSFTLRWFSVDAWGNAEAVQSASYVLDTSAPTVVATDPAASSTGVSEGTVVIVSFSEPMAPDASAALTLVGPAGAVTGTATWDGAGQVLTFTPAAPLSRGASYTIGVGTGARDLAGNALASPFAATFTTRSAVDQVSGPSSATLEPGGIAFDAAGDGVAVWRATPAQKIFYACYSAASGSWSGAGVLDGMSGSGYQAPRVAAGAGGFVVGWIGSGVKTAVFTGCTPGPVTTLATGFYGYSLAVGANASGYLVAWAGTDYGSWAARFEGGAWTSPTYYTYDTFVDAIAAAGEGSGYRVLYTKSNAAYSVRFQDGVWSSPQRLGYAAGNAAPAVASTGAVTCMAWNEYGDVSGRVELGGSGTTATVIRGVSGSPTLAMNGGRCLVMARSDLQGASVALHDGAAWTPAVVLSLSGTVTGVGVAPWGAADFAGVAIAGGDVFVSRSTSGVWGTPVRAESSSQPASAPFIASASAASAYVLFEQPDGSADQVWTTRYDGSGAAAPQLRSTLPTAGNASVVKLAAAANGDVLAIWTQQNQGKSCVYWAWNQGGTWGAPQLLASDAAAAAIASNGADFMVAYETGLTAARALAVRRFAGGSFAAPTTLVSSSGLSGYEALATDGTGYAIVYVVYASGYQASAQIFEGSSWGSTRQLTAAGSSTTSVSLAGRPGEYLAAWINQAGAVSAMSWRAVKSGATWTWDGASRTIASPSGYSAVALASGPTEFMALWSSSSGVSFASMSGGTWASPTVLRSNADTYAIASSGSTYLAATSQASSAGATQVHAWTGSWRAAQNTGWNGRFTLAVASNGSGYGVLADDLSHLVFISVPDPVSSPIGAPLRLDTATVYSTPPYAAQLVPGASGYCAAWVQQDPGDASLRRVYARGAL